MKCSGIPKMEPNNETWELAEPLPVYSMILGKSPHFWVFSFFKIIKLISYTRRIWSQG